MSIEDRWTEDHPEYTRADHNLKNRQFIHAVEDVEGLIVQRLFELSKSNLAGTGMVYSSISVLD
jgi:hypothetical protein